MTALLRELASAGSELAYEALLKIRRRRYPMRTYRPDPIPVHMIEKVLETARWAPSGTKCQPWDFIVVKNRQLMQRICDVSDRENISRRAGDLKFTWPKDSYVSSVPVSSSCVQIPGSNG